MKAAPFEPLETPASDAQEEEDPLLGETLAGTYRIDRVAAEGGMGRLYAGVHTRLGMEVAVKVSHEVRGTRPDSIARAERVARAMVSIISPHVARVLDLVRTADGRPCLVTELLKGHDLSQHLEKVGKLEAKEAARIAHDISLGLAAAHAQGVLHRDFKPSNVFLTDDGEVKLLDFGVAKLEGTHTLTHAGAFIGTPAYMSPEQAASPSDIDERAEVYAVGAVLYHMLSGQPPYGTLDATQTLTRLLRGEPPRLSALTSSVPEGLAALVERAMSRNPQDRFPTIDALAEALAPYVKGEADGATEQHARWLRPRAIAMVLSYAVLAGLWAASMAYAIGRVAGAFEAWPEWALIVLRATPAVVLVMMAVTGLRMLLSRWRSAPRVEALMDALGRAAWVGLASFGALEGARLVAGLFDVQTGLADGLDAIASLALAACVALAAALVGARRRAR